MLIDTHCHLNLMVKKSFDTPLQENDYQTAQNIIEQARKKNISKIINVGTNIIESINCIELAKRFSDVYASIGIHPNDLTAYWLTDFIQLKKLLATEQKIVAIGECGIDLHYPDSNLARQKDAFKAQIELALEHNLALVIHSRDAAQETLDCLEEFKHNNLRGTMHCFSYDLEFAMRSIELGFVLGIGGTMTYPKNNTLRQVVQSVGLEHIILETDAPFLPIQSMRGKQNSPVYIQDIAQFIGNMLEEPWEVVAERTTDNAQRIFNF